MQRGFRLQGKLTTIILGIVVLCVLVSTVVSLWRLSVMVGGRLESTGIFISQTFATFCVENLLAWDYPALQLSLEHAAGYDPHILGIEIYHKLDVNRESNLVAHYKNETGEKGLEYNAPVIVKVLDEKKEIGNVKILLSEKKYSGFYLQQIFSLLALALILGLGDTFLIFLTVKKLILQPLGRIEKGVHIIREGNLEHDIKVESKDEIGSLAGSFNTLLAKLRQMRAREKLISRMKSEFISIAAHQLRTPLSAMKWSLSMILAGDMGKIDSSVEEQLKKTYQSNDRLIELMNSLLSIARIEEGRYLYDLKAVSIKKLFRDIINYSNDLAFKQKIKIKSNITEVEIPKVKLDLEKFSLALQNLLNNAIKYSIKGSEVIASLKYVSGQNENFVQIEIKDFGIGIEEEDKDRLFTKFFRGKQAMEFHSEGTGLGLFITKNIIEAHGGKIWFDSEKGKGSTFYIKLPTKY